MWRGYTWGWGCENSNKENDCWMDYPIQQCDQHCRGNCVEHKRIRVVHLIIVALMCFVRFEYNLILFLVYIQWKNSVEWELTLIFEIFNLVFLVTPVFLKKILWLHTCNCDETNAGQCNVMVYHIHSNKVDQSSIKPFIIGICCELPRGVPDATTIWTIVIQHVHGQLILHIHVKPKYHPHTFVGMFKY